MGIVFMFIGYTGAAFNVDVTKEIQPGSSFDLGHYNLQMANISGARTTRMPGNA